MIFSYALCYVHYREVRKGYEMTIISPQKCDPVTTTIQIGHCPYCGVAVNPIRLQDHKSLRCPKAPREVLACRPGKYDARQHMMISTGGRLFVDPERAEARRNYARMIREQRDGMSD